MKTVYPKFSEICLSTGGGLVAGDIKVLAVDTALYTYSATHEFLSDIAAGARIASSANLASKTVTNGYFDFTDPSITFGSTPPSIEALVIYVDTGVAGTSRLVYYTDEDTGLPFTPGTSQVVNWLIPSGGIFRIGAA